MIVLDANVLIYAYDASSPQHGRAKSWFESALNSGNLVGIPWLSIWAFIRILTNARIVTRPVSIDLTIAVATSWLEHPNVVAIGPGDRHLELLERFTSQGQAAGPRLTDAVLASLAHEHGATLVSTDRDFARFPDLRWLNPLDEAPPKKRPRR